MLELANENRTMQTYCLWSRTVVFSYACSVNKVPAVYDGAIVLVG